MTTTTPTKTLAFFGATGDCAGYCLAAALNAGYTCTALARTPSKLTSSLKAKGVSPEVQQTHLTIIEGNVKDLSAVKQTLAPNGKLVDTIMSGIGGTPQLQWSLWRPVTINDTTICQDAGATIMQAARELSNGSGQRKPLFINVSTTGIPAPGMPGDVPFLFVALYHWILAAPHEDKRVLEERLREEMQKPESERGLGGYVNVKPSLLMDGEKLGVDKVRVGGERTPAVGYTVRRADVGEWIFEKLMRPTEVPMEWRDSSVCITY